MVVILRSHVIQHSTNDMKPRLRSWLPVVLILIFVTTSLGQQNEQASEDKVAYREFKELISDKCMSCHTGRFPDGGLSFDTKSTVDEGGDSGGPILSTDKNANELWKRITHEDLAIRMPKNAPALTEEELAVVSKWIETGAYWPDAEPPKQEVVTIGDENSNDEESFFVKTFADLNDQLALLPHRILRILVLIGICLFFLLIERKKKSRAKAHGPSRDLRWWEKLNGFHLTSFLLIFAMWNFAEMKHHQVQEVNAKFQRLKSISNVRVEKPAPVERVETGIPQRIRHKKSLAKTYYRGNCEYNDKLYNQGNYRTATFQLWLSDTSGNPLNVGDSLPDECLIQLEMVRAKGAAESLFAPNVMQTVFATTNSVKHNNLGPVIAQFVNVEPMEKWQCTIPVRPDEHSLDEPIVFHICKGDVFEGEGSGKPHYGIIFETALDNGKLTEQSDLWMGNLLVSARLIPLQDKKIPPGEWFDVRPIPEIEGKNSDDPDLIGTPEHLDDPKK